jgi:hypothetical protein
MDIDLSLDEIIAKQRAARLAATLEAQSAATRVSAPAGTVVPPKNKGSMKQKGTAGKKKRVGAENHSTKRTVEQYSAQRPHGHPS